jgi:nitrogen fixation protein NifZ
MAEPVPLAEALDAIEIYRPPVLAQGTKVRTRAAVRNDGTFPGRRMGEILVEKGEVGYVANIGTFLQRYYIYGVDFFRIGCVVGMRAHELELVDELKRGDELKPVDKLELADGAIPGEGKT